MTWAPRGILRTTSLRVGRRARNERPVEPVTVQPSVAPMMSSWASDAGVGVEGGPGHQGQEVAALLGVDEEHALPRREGARHGCSGFDGGGDGVAVAHRDEHLLAR